MSRALILNAGYGTRSRAVLGDESEGQLSAAAGDDGGGYWAGAMQSGAQFARTATLVAATLAAQIASTQWENEQNEPATGLSSATMVQEDGGLQAANPAALTAVPAPWIFGGDEQITAQWDEDRQWQNLVKPLQTINTLPRMWEWEQHEPPFGNPPVAEVAVGATNRALILNAGYQKRPYRFETFDETLPVPLVQDEDFWSNPVLPVQGQLRRLSLWHGEVGEILALTPITVTPAPAVSTWFVRDPNFGEILSDTAGLGELRLGPVQTMEEASTAINDILAHINRMVPNVADPAPTTGQKILVQEADGTWHLWDLAATGATTATVDATNRKITFSS